MSSFKFVYLSSCDSLKLKPNDKVLYKIDESLDSNVLNLSTVELDVNICKALGFALSKDVFLQELDLSNCMLSSEGFLGILSGLQNNIFLKTLILKGNNIKSSGTEELGKFFRHNNHLENLYLEWNGIGIFPEKFAYFCEGLVINSSLKLLDLKNNQLSHVCAQLLSTALCRNSSLQILDLRWNNIGLLGGRELLKALKNNKSLLKIEVSGNNIPLEIQQLIESLTAAAAERYLLKNENIERSKVFSSKIQEIEAEKTNLFKILMEQLDKKDKDIMSNQRWSSSKLIELQEALSEKENVVDTLKKKCKELNVVTEEKNNLVLELNTAQIKFKECRQEYQHLFEKEKKEKERMERKLLEEIESLKGENSFLKQKVKDLSIINTNLEDQMLKLENTIKKLENAYKSKESSFQDQLSLLKEKHIEEVHEINEMGKNEISRIKNNCVEVENILKGKVSLLETQKNKLEKALIEKEHQILVNQKQADEKIEDLKRKLKSDEERLKDQMEEKIHVLVSANKRQEEQLKEQLQIIHDMNRKTTESDLLLAEEAHRTERLQKELEAKNAEKENAVTKVKLKVKEELEELEQTKQLLANFESEKVTLQMKIKDLEEKLLADSQQNTETVQALNFKVCRLKTKFKEILESQDKRINDLHLSLTSYLEFENSELDVEISNSEKK